MVGEVHKEGKHTFADGVHGDLHAVRLVADLRDAFKDQFQFGDVRRLLIDFLFILQAYVSEFFLLHSGFEQELFSVFL